jgi:hypothetical protein
MNKLKVFFLLAWIFCAVSCNKNDDKTTPDDTPVILADKVTGTYTGEMFIGNTKRNGTTIIDKTGENKVQFRIPLEASEAVFVDIAVTNGGSNTYNLSFSIENDFINGVVDGRELTYEIHSGVTSILFTGYR